MMGYKSRYSDVDIANVNNIINFLAFQSKDAMATGFVNWGAKQDLYKIKFHLDSVLKTCPNFGTMESEWLKEQERIELIKILKQE